VVPFLSSLSLLFVEAYPTSYAASPTGFSVGAIVRGQRLFASDCAVCHEPRNGTGGADDLMAAHVWEHLDGDLFWWLTNGISDPRGNKLMPPFASVLSDEDRWALIDFIHARSAGLEVKATGRWPVPVAAPATPIACGRGNASSIADLGGQVLLVAADSEPDGQQAPEDEPGVSVIWLGHGGRAGSKSAEAGGDCAAAASEAWDAWALLAGVPPDRFSGYQVVVDGEGWLRAWLPPGASAARMREAVRDARDHAIEAAGRPSTGHHH
jgi:hypothetical protein